MESHQQHRSFSRTKPRLVSVSKSLILWDGVDAPRVSHIAVLHAQRSTMIPHDRGSQDRHDSRINPGDSLLAHDHGAGSRRTAMNMKP